MTKRMGIILEQRTAGTRQRSTAVVTLKRPFKISAIQDQLADWGSSLKGRSFHYLGGGVVRASLGWSRPFAGERLNQRRVSLKIRLCGETVHGRCHGPRQLF